MDPTRTGARRLGRLLLRSEAARTDVNALKPSVDQNSSPLHIRVEHTVGLRGTELPLATMVVADVPAEHLFLPAKIALRHVILLDEKGTRAPLECQLADPVSLPCLSDDSADRYTRSDAHPYPEAYSTVSELGHLV